MQKAIFKGVWSVVELENRERGEWKREAVFEPDEWSIGFLEGGRWLEIFRIGEAKESGRWVFDDRTGILSTAPDTIPEFLQHYVFEGDTEQGWLHIYDDAPHIPPDRTLIAAHHSYRRLRIIR
jgi:hypothetical protein